MAGNGSKVTGPPFSGLRASGSQIPGLRGFVPKVVGPRRTGGVRVPLFDRLVESGGPGVGEADEHGHRMLDREGLKASIAHELSRLLNTRAPLAADRLEVRPRSTLDYGLPDLSLFWPYDGDSEKRLAEAIIEAVTAFEPRLRRPSVVLERVAIERRALRARVGGVIELDGMVEPVTFPILMNHDGDEGCDDAG